MGGWGVLVWATNRVAGIDWGTSSGIDWGASSCMCAVLSQTLHAVEQAACCCWLERTPAPSVA